MTRRYKKLQSSSDDEETNLFINNKEEDSPSKVKFQMKRSIDVLAGVSIVAGSIIGSGIFIIPSNILNYCQGDVMLSLSVWVLAGVVAMLVAFCHCELATLIPESGGAAVYLKKAFGDWISFVYLWLFLLTVHGQSMAIQSIAFGAYVTKSISQSLFTICNDSDSDETFHKLIGVTILMLLAYVNISQLKLALKFQVFCTFGKVVALVLVSFFGLLQLFKNKDQFVQNIMHKRTIEESPSDQEHQMSILPSVSLAIFEGLWAYDGFDSITLVTEEVKNPAKSLPRIIIFSVITVMALYMFVFVSFLSVLSVDEIMGTSAIAVDYSMKINPWLSQIITMSVCLSLVGSINNTFISAGRLPFVAARAGFMPKIFSMVHIDHLTPVPGIIGLFLMSVLMLVPSSLNELLDAVLFCAWIFKALCCVGLVVLRYKMPFKERPYKVYTITAVLSFTLVLYLVSMSLMYEPKPLYFLTIAFSLLFLLLYVLMRRGRVNLSRMKGKQIRFMQKLLKCAATEEEEARN